MKNNHHEKNSLSYILLQKSNTLKKKKKKVLGNSISDLAPLFRNVEYSFSSITGFPCKRSILFQTIQFSMSWRFVYTLLNVKTVLY